MAIILAMTGWRAWLKRTCDAVADTCSRIDVIRAELANREVLDRLIVRGHQLVDGDVERIDGGPWYGKKIVVARRATSRRIDARLEEVATT